MCYRGITSRGCWNIVEGMQDIRTLDRQFERVGSWNGPSVPKVEFHSTAKFKDRCFVLLAQAREQIYFANSPIVAGVTAKFTIFREPLLAALDRRVQVALLEDFETLEADGRKEFLRELKARGADVRISDAAPTGMIIVDRRCALVFNHSIRDRQCCVSIRSDAIVALLQRLADSTWRTSWDLELLPLLERRDCAILLAVMRLLGSGYKDELGARLLGVSLRTYRRHVADLLQALSAGSRFEAGVRAARLGLLS